MLCRFVIAVLLSAAAYGRGPAPTFFIEREGVFVAHFPGWQAHFSPAKVDLPGVTLEFAGASQTVTLEGTGRQPASVHSLIGRAGAGLGRRSAMYTGVRYRGIYPGIDLLYGAQEHEMKSEFLLSAGADAASIRVLYRGSRDLHLAPDGSLRGKTDHGDFQERAPFVYQEGPSGRVIIPSAFVLLSSDTVGFSIGEYRRELPLVIDPALSFSTLLGGNLFDAATAIATDAAGNLVVAGWTESVDFPANLRQTASGGGVDAFVAKFSPAGQLRFATYLGGRGEDRATGVAVDAAGAIWVTGWTTSADFPLLSPRQSTPGGGRDVFLVKLDANGSSLQFGTYLGGSLNDVANGIAVDASGSVYLAGETSSPDFPVLNAFQSHHGGRSDAFAAKFSNAGSLLYSTLVGGTEEDVASAIAVDAAGSAVLTGSTNSANFPVVAAAQPQSGGGQDAFVLKLSPQGNALVFSTYLGGPGGIGSTPEGAAAVALTPAAEIYVVGTTTSTGFATSGVFQTAAPGGGYDGFLAKYSATGSMLFRSYLGGSSVERIWGVAAAGNSVIVAGHSGSPDFPMFQPVQSRLAGAYDAFVSRLSNSGTHLEFGTWLGGVASDAALAVSLGPGGAIYIAGQTQSLDFPLASAVQTANPGNFGAFVAVIKPDAARPQTVSATPAAGGGVSQVFEAVVSHADGFNAIASAEIAVRDAGAHTCQVRYVAQANALELLNDSGLYSGAIVPGGAGSLQNSQCTVSAQEASVQKQGTTLTLRVPLSFRTTYTGDLLIAAADVAGQNTGWQKYGTWAASAPPPVTPQILGISPSSGSGTTQVFEALFSHASGYGAIASAEVSIRDAGVHTCQVRYLSQTNTLALLSDSGIYSGSIVPGGAGSLQNSHCILSASQSSISAQGTTLTLRVALSFRTTYTGDVYAAAKDVAGHDTGWQKYGTWAASAPPPVTPNTVGISPASGSGTTQVFEAVFSHASGNGAIASAEVSIRDTGGHTCQVRYVSQTNTLELLNDSGVYGGSLAPGGAGSLQNSYCTVGAPQSSISRQGTVLTVRVSLSFRITYTGDLYIAATDIAGYGTGWQKYGTWSATQPPPVTPSLVGISPSTGAGTSQVFEAVYSHAEGFAALASVEVSIRDTGGRTCQIRYAAQSNTLELLNDAGVYGGSLAPATAGTLQNSRCTVSAPQSSVLKQGTTLTLRVFLSFNMTYTGDLYIAATDISGHYTGWQKYGSWGAVQPPPVTPSVVGISPASGSGASQLFAITYSDPQGAQSLLWTHLLIGSGGTARSCYVRYERAANALYLAADDGITWTVALPLGTAGGVVQNTQCLLDAEHSSASAAGNTLTVAVALTFKSTFAGARSVSASADGTGGRSSGLVKAGDFNVVPGPNHQPTTVAAHPSSGSGSSVTLRVVFEDVDGVANISRTHIMIAGAAGGTCWVVYDRPSDVLYVVDDQGGGLGGSMTPGTNAYIANQQCWIEGMQSYVITTPTLLVVTIQAGFKPSFAGEKTFRALVADTAGWGTNWETIGTWTATGSVAMPPAPEAVTPAFGEGASQIFAAAYSDPNGYEDMGWIHFLVTLGSEKNACYVLYDRRRNMIFLANEMVSEVYGYLTPGVPGVLQNNQCLVDGTGSAVMTSGTTLTLSITLRFKSSFAGLRHIFTAANDMNDWSTGWRYRGSWTVPAGTNQQPAIISLAPSAGAGTSANLAVVFSDANGWQDIARSQILITASPGAPSCFLSYDRAANVFSLIQDNGTAVSGSPGAGVRLESGQCSLNLATSSVQRSGSNLTFVVGLTFKPGFAGQKTVYLLNQDVTGWSTNWQVYGSWVVR